MSKEKEITSDKHPPFHIELAQKVIENLKTNGSFYTPGWKDAAPELPFNPASNRRYRGGNLLNLWLTAMLKGWNDPRWMTYRQAQEQGYQVRRGEGGSRIVFIQSSKEVPLLNDRGEVIRDEEGKVKTRHVSLERPMIRHSFVFNGNQIEGIPSLERRTKAFEPIEGAEKILTASGASLFHDQLSKAFYRPSTDSIHLPERGQFHSPELYYATALHELCHWTGHESRLARLDENSPFGSQEYAREELRAEIGSLLITQELGLTDDYTRSVGYLSSWVSLLEEQPRAILTACADAEAIRGYIMAFVQEETLNMAPEMSTEQSTTPMVVVSEAPEQSSPLTAQSPNQSPRERTYLVVPYAEKDEAKAVAKQHGFSIMWDRGAKAWFVPTGIDPAPLSKWMIGARATTPPISLAQDPVRAFGEKLRSIGLEVTEPVLDGTMKRVSLIGGSPKKKDGAYVGSLDGIPGGWGKNYKTGDEVKWRAHADALLSDAEVKKLLDAATEKSARQAEARKEVAIEVAEQIRHALSTMKKAESEHPYLKKKGIDPAHLFQDEKGRLVVPLQNNEGVITSLQRISGDGTKLLEKGGVKKGSYFVVSREDPPESASCIVIAEGLATAKSLHAALSHRQMREQVSVVMAVDAYNLVEVAQKLKEKNNEARFVFAADRDRPKEGENIGVGEKWATEAAQAVSGQVVVPSFLTFSQETRLTDFNDLHASEGLFAVRQQLEEVVRLSLTSQHETREFHSLESDTQSITYHQRSL